MSSFKNSFFPKVLCLFVFTSFFYSCKTANISDLSQDDGIVQIKKSYEKKDWTDVIDKVSEYKVRYPYSKHITQADLMQADAYYQSDKFPEAILTYEDFIKKNPNHQSAPLAYYRIAKSYDFQAPDVESRDQSNTQKALEKYRQYRQNYPNSEWADEATTRAEVLNRRLADSDAFVAEFYWHTDHCAASLSRYLIILEKYTKYDALQQLAKTRASQCYQVLAKELEKDPESKTYVYFQTETAETLQKKSEQLTQ